MTDSKKLAAYEILDVDDKEDRHAIAVLVDNEFGVLARVIGLFSSRGYNIHSLTVSEVDHEKHLSRITIVTEGSQTIIRQIMALLDRLVPVYEVRDLSTDSPHIERTLGLIKVINSVQKDREHAQEVADKFGARTIDSTAESFIFELSDTSENLDHFIDALNPFGVVEICRTGVTAIARGTNIMNVEKEEAV